MKLITITALALLATSCVNAINWSAYNLRGQATDTNTEVPAELASRKSRRSRGRSSGRNRECQSRRASGSDGKRDGTCLVDDLFRDDCANALDRSFKRDVRKAEDRAFGGKERNFRERDYNKKGKRAVKKELDRIGKLCLNNDQGAETCNDLGDIAARDIVEASNVCPRYESAARGQSNLKKFQRTCRRVAYGRCEGQIRDAIKDVCGRKTSVSIDEQSDLQDKCRREVDRLTGRDEVDFMDVV